MEARILATIFVHGAMTPAELIRVIRPKSRAEHDQILRTLGAWIDARMMRRRRDKVAVRFDLGRKMLRKLGNGDRQVA